MTTSLQEAFLYHRGLTYGHVGAISASLGDILGRCGASLGPLGCLKKKSFAEEVCKQKEVDDVKLSLL